LARRLYDNIDKTFHGRHEGNKWQLKELPKIYPNVYNIKSSDRKFERVVTYVPFGDTQSKPEGEAFVMDVLRQGYTKDFTHTENGLGFEVTQTALEDDVENILNRAGRVAGVLGAVRRGRPRGESVQQRVRHGNHPGRRVAVQHRPRAQGRRHREESALDGCGSLGDLAHAGADRPPDRPEGRSGASLGSGGFDWILYIPPQLEFLADRLLNSVGSCRCRRTTTATRSKRGGSWQIVVNPRLTDTDAWFLVAARKRGTAHVLSPDADFDGADGDRSADGNRIFKCGIASRSARGRGSARTARGA
jgi:hypothetical protein